MYVDANVSFGLLQACTPTLKGLWAEAYRFCLGHCFSFLRPGAGPCGVAEADNEKHRHVVSTQVMSEGAQEPGRTGMPSHRRLRGSWPGPGSRAPAATRGTAPPAARGHRASCTRHHGGHLPDNDNKMSVDQNDAMGCFCYAASQHRHACERGDALCCLVCDLPTHLEG